MNLEFPPRNEFWVMGLTFFHNYYTVFDVENKRIGMAESAISEFRNSIKEEKIKYIGLKQEEEDNNGSYVA
jgi:hypothetical protein